MCVTIVATPIAINTPHLHCKCKRQSTIGSHNRNHNQKRNRLSMPTCNDMLTSNDNLIERNEPICIAIARWRWRRYCSGTVCLCFGRRNVYLRTYLGVECVVLQFSNCLGINKMASSSNNVNVQQIPKQTNRRRRAGGSHWQRRWSEVSKQKWRMSADWYYPVRQLHSYTHTHIHQFIDSDCGTWQSVWMHFHLAFPLRPYFICAVRLQDICHTSCHIRWLHGVVAH